MTTRPERKRVGAATVEFAVLAPFLFWLAVITTDWARLFYYSITMDACARNGALYAADDEMQLRSPYANLHAAAVAEAPHLKNTITATSASTMDSNTKVTHVTVSVSMQFSTLTNFPGVPKNQTIARTVTMRKVPNVTN